MRRIRKHSGQKGHKRHQKKHMGFLEALRLYAEMPVEKW